MKPLFIPLKTKYFEAFADGCAMIPYSTRPTKGGRAQFRDDQMGHVIHLVGCASGIATQHDGRYVVDYAPPPMNERGEYENGGRLVTSPDPAKAKRFADAIAALEYWRMQNGLRPDGEPNRPLTAWAAEILDEVFIE